MQSEKNKSILLILFASFIIWFAFRLAAPYFFDNNWSFTHWNYIPVWYLITITLLFSASVLFSKQLLKIFMTLLDKKINLITIGCVIIILFVVFRIDSVLYGGGNLRISQLTQTNKIGLPWHEYGSIAVISFVLKIVKLFESNASFAAGLSLRLFTYLSVILTAIGSYKFINTITEDKSKRIPYLMILLFSSPAILFFGFIGIEVAIVAVTIWFFLFIKLYYQFDNQKYLLLAFLTFVVGIFLHQSLIFLLPGLLYILIIRNKIKLAPFIIALIVSFVSINLFIWLLYILSDNFFSFAQSILATSGRQPSPDYKLFSSRHISDFLQIILLSSPLILFVIYVILKKISVLYKKPLLMSALITFFSSLIWLYIQNPFHSIVLDSPRYLAYLFPLSILVVSIFSEYSESEINLKTISAYAFISIFVTLSLVPLYSSTHNSEEYVVTYFEKQPEFHRTGDTALRDSFFYIRDIDKANEWETNLPYNSTDFLSFRGCSDLAFSGQVAEAIKILKRISVRNPYWVEPRELMASLYLRQNKPELAKPQIDTAMMINRYRKAGFKNLSQYYQANRDFYNAEQTLNNAIYWHPDDLSFKTDITFLMIRAGKLTDANEQVNKLLIEDSSHPHANLAKAYIMEYERKLDSSIFYYKKFVELAPKDPEAVNAMNKIDELNKLIIE